MGQTYKGFQTLVLALTFSHVLKNWLQPAELIKIIELNDGETSNACYTHDFCDANQAMIDAFMKVFNRTPKMQFEYDVDIYDVDIINAAWEMAKKERFYTVI